MLVKLQEGEGVVFELGLDLDHLVLGDVVRVYLAGVLGVVVIGRLRRCLRVG